MNARTVPGLVSEPESLFTHFEEMYCTNKECSQLAIPYPRIQASYLQIRLFSDAKQQSIAAPLGVFPLSSICVPLLELLEPESAYVHFNPNAHKLASHSKSPPAFPPPPFFSTSSTPHTSTHALSLSLPTISPNPQRSLSPNRPPSTPTALRKLLPRLLHVPNHIPKSQRDLVQHLDAIPLPPRAPDGVHHDGIDLLQLLDAEARGAVFEFGVEGAERVAGGEDEVVPLDDGGGGGLGVRRVFFGWVQDVCQIWVGAVAGFGDCAGGGVEGWDCGKWLACGEGLGAMGGAGAGCGLL